MPPKLTFDVQQELLIEIDTALATIHSSVTRMRDIQTQLLHYTEVLQGRTAFTPVLDKLQ